MAWVVVAGTDLVTKGVVDEVVMVTWVEIVIFSVYLYIVLVGGDIIMNKFVLGLYISLKSIQEQSLGEYSYNLLIINL